jgi:3-isopropylmalate dehydrogenase
MGGSAPKYTGQNVINPIASVAAMQMLLSVLGEDQAALQVESAIQNVVRRDMKSMAAGRMGLSTSQVGDKIADYIVNEKC